MTEIYFSIRFFSLFLAVILVISGFSLAEESEMSPDSLEKMMEKLRPLHKKLGKPSPGDWLSVHQEYGQTFKEYLQCKPITPQGNRRVIYVQPLGDFTKTQR